jgi:hypothetical protein
MLVKKPVGPGTCLSCDKTLSRFGGLGEYKSWKKLPKETVEKAQKFGPGYSKVLNKLRREHSVTDSPREGLNVDIHENGRAYGSDDDNHHSPPKYEQPGENSHHFLPDTIKGATLEPPPPAKFSSSLNNGASHYYKNKSTAAIKPEGGAAAAPTANQG